MSSSSRPLPLKQRTSSQDTRRDYSHNTWASLLFLLKVREYFVTVDNFSIWRRHLAWAMESGKDLRNYTTQRYASNMVFMSLLLSTQLGVLFNSAAVTTTVRKELREGHHFSLSFWAGFMIIISSLFTILSLISTFTAWSMVNAVDEHNVHCIFRSSIGQYAAELPGRLIVCSIYSFLISFCVYFFLLLPFGTWSILLLATTLFLFIHIISVFSAFGRVIMHTGAMGNSRIFSEEYEDFLIPHSLHTNLKHKAKANLEHNTSIIRQYRRKQLSIDRYLQEEEMYDHLCGKLPKTGLELAVPHRSRADSLVRFADEEQGNASSSHHHHHYHHSRTLTPLSDTSHTTPTTTSPFLLSSDTLSPPVRKDSASKSSLRKTSSLAAAARPKPVVSRPPPIPPPSTTSTNSNSSSTSQFGAEALRNVSENSLDGWLQQTSPINADTTATTATATPSSTTTTIPRSLQNTPSPRIPAPPLPTSEGNGDNDLMDHLPDPELTLTEEERFRMDYGDSPEKPSPNYLTTTNNEEDYDLVMGERMGLLAGAQDHNEYHPYFSTTTSSMIQTKKPPQNKK